MDTFNRRWVCVGLYSPPAVCTAKPAAAQQTRDIEPMLVWCWASVADVGLELDQHWVNVLCLPGVLTGYIVFRTSKGVKILKLLLNGLSLKIEPNGFHHIKIHSRHITQEPFININYKSHWHYMYYLSTFMVMLLEGRHLQFFFILLVIIIITYIFI